MNAAPAGLGRHACQYANARLSPVLHLCKPEIFVTPLFGSCGGVSVTLRMFKLGRAHGSTARYCRLRCPLNGADQNTPPTRQRWSTMTTLPGIFGGGSKSSTVFGESRRCVF
jgi:hypothetical protein